MQRKLMYVINSIILNIMMNKQDSTRTKLKTEEKTMTLHEIKTEFNNFGKICLNSGIKMEFGKPVKLPLIKRKKQQTQQINEQCYSSRTSHQNNSLSNLQKELSNDEKIQKKQNLGKHERSSSFLTKLLMKQTATYGMKDRSLDATKMNISAVQQSQLICNQDEKHLKVKCLPKIFRYKYFKQPGQKIERIKSQRNVIKLQTFETMPKYKIGNLLGQGTYAVVRTGKSESNQIVAIKTYQKSKLKDIEKKQNIKREIEILQKINHPNIIKFIEVIQTNLSINIITELVQNTSLLEYLKNSLTNKLAEEQAKYIFRQIAQSIAYLHNLSIIHRDIKLQNILITKQKLIKLIDFGFSIQTNSRLNSFCGTPSYISPEIISKKGYYGKPADVWSCGIVLYRMLCGVFPYKALNQKTLYAKISKGSFRFAAQISMGAQIIINKMLCVDPQSRISIEEVLKQSWFTQ